MEDNKTQPPKLPQNDSEKPKLVDVNVSDENTALNLLVGFCNLAQQRGVFNLQESAKIWECIQKFQKE
jgi:hypothetical protein|tara:strand:- start:239 stop:442 length:204 start_codon:yes stop_codon:yes gene_type:complete